MQAAWFSSIASIFSELKDSQSVFFHSQRSHNAFQHLGRLDDRFTQRIQGAVEFGLGNNQRRLDADHFRIIQAVRDQHVAPAAAGNHQRGEVLMTELHTRKQALAANLLDDVRVLSLHALEAVEQLLPQPR